MKLLLKTLFIISILHFNSLNGQNTIPINTDNWQINAKSYVLESFKGKDAIYLVGGIMKLKDRTFLNGTIEFDIYLKNATAYPGVYFRLINDIHGEQWYIRPHQSGNPDANQAAPIINGITPWQLCVGEKYSFKYNYKYDDWTHVKIMVKDDKAQVFLDYSEQPNLSWNLFNTSKSGEIVLRGGNRDGMYIANVSVDNSTPNLVNFKPIERKAISGLISKWAISNPFKESILNDKELLNKQLNSAKWLGSIEVEEGTAANISRKVQIKDRAVNTVFAKIEIDSNKEQQKLFHFGYSERAVLILNGQLIYKGSNKFRSRDYRYLGTIGLYDAAYLNLKKGSNTLIMAVAEDFGGWLVTGKFDDSSGLKIK